VAALRAMMDAAKPFQWKKAPFRVLFLHFSCIFKKKAVLLQAKLAYYALARA